MKVDPSATGISGRRRRRPWLELRALGILILSLGQFSVAVATRAVESRPNILFILADDVGQEALECYGGESYATPNLDRLAADGLRFDHVYSAPVCHPSRITLLTGRYPVHVDNPAWGTFPATVESQTIAAQLQRAGYATAVAGKWQLTLLKNDLEQPHRLGFDTYCLFGWHEGPRYHRPHLWQDGKLRHDVADRYGPNVYTDFLIEFMGRKEGRPFFAFYSMALCHAVSDDFDPPPPYGPHERYETFGEMIVTMDRQVGKLLAALDRLGLTQNTIVLFTSDNGSPGSNFLRHDGSRFISEKVVSTCQGRAVPGAKGKLSDWGIRVPTMARWPGVVAPGTTTSALIDFSDFLPTFCKLGRASLPDIPLDGRSFVGVLRGKAEGSREWVHSQSQGLFCIRNREWKLTSANDLFAVSDDPFGEQLVPTDSDTPASIAARAALRAQLDRILHPQEQP